MSTFKVAFLSLIAVCTWDAFAQNEIAAKSAMTLVGGVNEKPFVVESENYEQGIQQDIQAAQKYKNDSSEDGSFKYRNFLLTSEILKRCQKLKLNKCPLYLQGDEGWSMGTVGSSGWVTAAHVLDKLKKVKSIVNENGKQWLQLVAIYTNTKDGIQFEDIFLPSTIDDPGSRIEVRTMSGRKKGPKVQKISNQAQVELSDFAVIARATPEALKEVSELPIGKVKVGDKIFVQADSKSESRLYFIELSLPMAADTSPPGFSSLLGFRQGNDENSLIGPGDSGRPLVDLEGHFVGVLTQGQKITGGGVFAISFDPKKLN